MNQDTPPNWQILKQEYINSTLTAREMAEKYGVSEGALRGHITRGKWGEERVRLSNEIAQRLAEKYLYDRTEKLASFNAQDVSVAEKLKYKALNLLDRDNVTASELRCLASVFETAQKIGLLALGSATSKVDNAHEINEVPSAILAAISRKYAN